MDLTKLTPAPWTHRSDGRPDLRNVRQILEGPNDELVAYGQLTDADAAFCALARNAFDVMLRRGWTAIRVPRGWAAVEIANANWAASTANEMMWSGSARAAAGDITLEIHVAADPFSALVEADRWMAEQENAEGQASR